jgi:hypothetical protein
MRFSPTTTADPAQISLIAAWVNALPTAPTRTMNCGTDLGTNVELTFRARPDGSATAVVDANPGGCLGVRLTLGGPKQGLLWSPDGFVEKVYALLGIQACKLVCPVPECASEGCRSRARPRRDPGNGHGHVCLVGWYSASVSPNVHATPAFAVRVAGGTRSQ